jgi:hypothetical protein
LIYTPQYIFLYLKIDAFDFPASSREDLDRRVCGLWQLLPVATPNK